MSKYIKVDGVIEIPSNMNTNNFMDSFLEWIKDEHNSYFGGSYFEVDEKGDIVK